MLPELRPHAQRTGFAAADAKRGPTLEIREARPACYETGGVAVLPGRTMPPDGRDADHR